MLHRIWEQIGDLALFAMVSLIFGIIKLYTLPELDGWKQAISSLFVSIIIGTLAGALALQYQFGDYTALSVSSVASLLSRDIVLGILKNRHQIGELLKRAAFNLVEKFTK